MYKNSLLFELIKSLSKNEKRHFKMFSARHVQGNQNDYVALFDAIDKQKTYDEEAIKQHFRDKQFIKRLSSKQVHLHNRILMSLHVDYIDHSIDAQLNKLMHFMEILFNKGLYKNCTRILHAAKKLACANEKYLYLAKLINMERRILIRLGDITALEDFIKGKSPEVKKILNLYINRFEYILLAAKTHLARSKFGEIKNKEELKVFKAVMGHPLLTSERKARSLKAKQFYYGLKRLYFQENYKESIKYCIRSINLYEAHPQLIHEALFTYVAALANLLNCQRRLHQYTNMKHTIHKLKNIASKYPKEYTPYIDQSIFGAIINTEVKMNIEVGNFKTAVQLVPEIAEKLEHYGSRFPKVLKAISYHNIAYVYFGAKDYENSLKWINKLLNQPDKNIREDIYVFANIFNLILHYEMGNTELLEYMVRSAYRILLKTKSLHKYETSLVHFIRKKIPKIATDNDLKKAFKELRDELILIFKDPFEAKSLTYFDIISWIESKIENKPFAEIVKEKYESKR